MHCVATVAHDSLQRACLVRGMSEVRWHEHTPLHCMEALLVGLLQLLAARLVLAQQSDHLQLASHMFRTSGLSPAACVRDRTYHAACVLVS